MLPRTMMKKTSLLQLSIGLNVQPDIYVILDTIRFLE